jgi:hypothetical protein
MDFKKKDYIAAAVLLKDRYGIPLDEIKANDIEMVFQGSFIQKPTGRDDALDAMLISPTRDEARKQIERIYPHLKGRDDEAHTLPIITASTPPPPGPIVLLVERRGHVEWIELKTKIAIALDDIGVADGELFEITIRKSRI